MPPLTACRSQPFHYPERHSACLIQPSSLFAPVMPLLPMRSLPQHHLYNPNPSPSTRHALSLLSFPFHLAPAGALPRYFPFLTCHVIRQLPTLGKAPCLASSFLFPTAWTWTESPTGQQAYWVGSVCQSYSVHNSPLNPWCAAFRNDFAFPLFTHQQAPVFHLYFRVWLLEL